MYNSHLRTYVLGKGGLINLLGTILSRTQQCGLIKHIVRSTPYEVVVRAVVNFARR